MEKIEYITLNGIRYKVEPLSGETSTNEGDAESATTTDCISRRDALKPFCITSDGTRIPEVDCDNFPMEFSVKDIKRHLLSLPPVTPTERTGEWKHTMTYYPYCSECEWMPEEDEMTHGRYNYCPDCGAKMKG